MFILDIDDRVEMSVSIRVSTWGIFNSCAHNSTNRCYILQAGRSILSPTVQNLNWLIQSTHNNLVSHLSTIKSSRHFRMHTDYISGDVLTQAVQAVLKVSSGWSELKRICGMLLTATVFELIVSEHVLEMSSICILEQRLLSIAGMWLTRLLLVLWMSQLEFWTGVLKFESANP